MEDLVYLRAELLHRSAKGYLALENTYGLARMESDRSSEARLLHV